LFTATGRLCQVPAYGRQITLKRGVVKVTRPILNFAAPNDISRMAKAWVVKFCTQVDYIIY